MQKEKEMRIVYLRVSSPIFMLWFNNDLISVFLSVSISRPQYSNRPRSTSTKWNRTKIKFWVKTHNWSVYWPQPQQTAAVEKGQERMLAVRPTALRTLRLLTSHLPSWSVGRRWTVRNLCLFLHAHCRVPLPLLQASFIGVQYITYCIIQNKQKNYTPAAGRQHSSQCVFRDWLGGLAWFHKNGWNII